jgi:hypothetical protein
MTTSRRCTGTTSGGRRCAAWAVRGSERALCSAHGGVNPAAAAKEPNRRDVLDFYRRAVSGQERADLARLSRGASLEEEIATTRVVLRRLLVFLRDHPELDAAALARLAPLAFRGSQTVARLLRDQRALTGDSADGIAGAIGQALDELATEWGIEP